MDMFLRWLFAFVLLTATYNPTNWNFVAVRRQLAGQSEVDDLDD